MEDGRVVTLVRFVTEGTVEETLEGVEEGIGALEVGFCFTFFLLSVSFCLEAVAGRQGMLTGIPVWEIFLVGKPFCFLAVPYRSPGDNGRSYLVVYATVVFFAATS